MHLPSCCLISSTLQAGIGPSDANRLLAAEFKRMGLGVSLCSLHDPAVHRVENGELDLDGFALPALRIPASVPWPGKVSRVGEFFGEQEPEWLILRFISYSFQRKGIVLAAARHFPAMFRGRKLVVLLDEIWIGEGREPLRHMLVGRLQRWIILRMIQQLRPTLMFTNNLHNTRILQQQGVTAPLLRLFGSIPIAHPDGGAWLLGQLRQRNVPIDRTNRHEWILLGNFGACHPPWNPSELFASLKEYAAQTGRKVAILSIGNLGATEGHWNAIASRYSHDFAFAALGMQDVKSVSLFLHSIDWGITTNNYHHFGKSGTSMAMIEHGLPVVVTRIAPDDDLEEFGGFRVLRYTKETFPREFSIGGRIPPQGGVTRFAAELFRKMLP